MKATITIIAIAILSLQATNLFAANDNTPVVPKDNYSSSLSVSLAPVTPVEATFEDAVTTLDYSTLAPFIPAEATFEDTTADYSGLTPTIPATAEFDDMPTTDYSHLAPEVPVTADFE